MESEIKLGQYPFKSGDKRAHTVFEIYNHLGGLIDNPAFKGKNRSEIYSYITSQIRKAESYFDTKTNLLYHGVYHSVYESTYDAISTAKTLRGGNARLASHLTIEGIVAIPVAAAYHDTGYIFGAEENCNHAARMPIHVEQSIKAAQSGLEEIKCPDSLNLERIKILVTAGIHGTHFPYTLEKHQEFLELVKDLNPKEKKEAQIVRLSVQLADLGGQISRVNYLDHLKNLRKEIDDYTEGLGTQMIGFDHQIEEKAKQFCRDHAVSTAGKTANAFFGTDHNMFANEWHKKL